MMRSTLHLILILIATLAAAALAPQSAGQTTVFTEDFEDMGFVPVGEWGPQGLINEGWIFRNNSQALGPVAWVSGCCWEGLFTALSGTGYLAASQDSAAGGPAQYSAWAIVPSVPGQQTGDILTFYTVSTDTYWWVSAHMEVRYAPNGGSNTGTTAASVGDFTQALLTMSPVPNYNQGLYEGWSKWQIELPGPGRIAFRQIGTESLYFGVEDVSIEHPGPAAGPLPENFEDLGGVCGEAPCRLVETGWMFRDQGAYSQGPAWEPPYAATDVRAHTGFSFIKSQKGSVFGGPLDGNGSINTWAIMPEVAAQSGDVLSFFVRGHLGKDGRFQVRYSPSGGTSTGSGAEGVGDFTQVLFELSELSNAGWQEIFVTLPGPGRIAFRSYDPDEAFHEIPVVVAIDSLALNAPAHVPPLPQPGQTVNWTVADSPIVIFTDLYIPPTGTVMIEPGATVHIDPASTLHIGGTVNGHGTAGNPISIESSANYPPGVLINGTLDLTHTVINTQIEPSGHGSLLFDACNVTGPNGLIYNLWAPILSNDDEPPFIKIDHCTFTNANLIPADATLRLTNSTFINSIAWMNRGYFFLDNVSFDSGSLTLGRDQQNVHIDNITVQNAPGAAITVGGDNIGNDYFFGANNVLVNNGYPAAATGGILGGSVLPQTGNAVNAVLVDPGETEIRGPVNWHDPGIPYHVSPANHLFLEAEVNMHAGVTMKFPAGIAIRESNNFSTLGLSEDPVRLEALSGQWWAAWTPVRMEHTVVSNSQQGVINAVGLPGYFDSCIFTNNGRGLVGAAVVRKSQFLNNALGAEVSATLDLNGETNPNSFVGNGLAVQSATDARFNWWGHPTGPTASQNPGGQGDPVSSGVPVIPFRTTPPEFSNHPPVVRMQKLYFVTSPGSTIILNWTSTDTDLASHRVLISTQLDIPAHYQVVAENLPATQSSYALTVPDSNGGFLVRVEAVDAAGQIGWDGKGSYVDNIALDPTLVLPLPKDEPHFTLGHPIPLRPGLDFFDEEWALFDGQMVFESYGAAGVLPTTIDASTDTARLALVNAGGITFSNYFTVRPDTRLEDLAPSVQVVAPQGGTLSGGSTVSLSWTAGDDESVRAVTIQASYDGGMTYHDIARRLPGIQNSYNWRLPPLDRGIANVFVRVVAEDLRFQVSSDIAGPFTLVAGASGVLGDATGDGTVNVDDLIAVILGWGACPTQPASCPADVDGNGAVNVDDLIIVILNWN